MADENGSGRIDRIESALASLTTSVASLTDVTRLIADQVNRLAEAQIETQDTVEELGERVVELADHQKATDEALQRLAEAQQHTDEHLSALIATMDDLIRRTTPPPR